MNSTEPTFCANIYKNEFIKSGIYKAKAMTFGDESSKKQAQLYLSQLEAIRDNDKVAKILGLEYPGGPKVDKLASQGKDTYNLPYPLDDDTYNFSFSGIKSAVVNLVHNEKQRGNNINAEDMCTTFQNRVISVITKKTMKAVTEFKVNNLVIAGGVAANRGLREKLEELCKEKSINFSVPRIKYCTDNAAMIGSAAYYAYKKGIIADLKLNAKATDNLYKY